jgi:mannose-6-phosphate isomerase-like protein (cupin superfamily)
MTELVYEQVTDLRVLHKGAQRQAITKIRPAFLTEPTMSCNCYHVAPGERVSLHKHETKSELWFIISGSGVMTLGDETINVEPGMAILTPPNMPHALVNIGKEPIIFFDVAHPPSQRDPATGQNIGTIELEE